METLSIILGTLCIILFLLLKGVTKMRDNDFEDMTNIILSDKQKNIVGVGNHPKIDVKYHALRTAIVSMLKENRDLAEDVGKKDFHIENFLKNIAVKESEPKELSKFCGPSYNAHGFIFTKSKLSFARAGAPPVCEITGWDIGGIDCSKCCHLYFMQISARQVFVECNEIETAYPIAVKNKPKEPTKIYPAVNLTTELPYICLVHNCTIGGLVCQKCPELIEYGTNGPANTKFVKCKRISEALPTPNRK